MRPGIFAAVWAAASCALPLTGAAQGAASAPVVINACGPMLKNGNTQNVLRKAGFAGNVLGNHTRSIRQQRDGSRDYPLNSAGDERNAR